MFHCAVDSSGLRLKPLAEMLTVGSWMFKYISHHENGLVPSYIADIS